MNEKNEQIFKEIEDIRQDTLKTLDETDALIREAEDIIDSIPPEELDRILPLCKSDETKTGNQPSNIITKIWRKIKWT